MSTSRRLKVLVVDDESGMRALVKRCLEKECEILDAASGPQAIDLGLDAETLDLLITDQMMPEMEGHEVARRFRIRNPDLKVLYLTAHADRLFDAKQKMWDLEAYLEKPFSAESLRQAVALLVFERLEF